MLTVLRAVLHDGFLTRPSTFTSSQPSCHGATQVRPKKIQKYCLFTVRPQKMRKAGIGKNIFLGFLFKMCVSCMFYVDFELDGQNNL